MGGIPNQPAETQIRAQVTEAVEEAKKTKLSDTSEKLVETQPVEEVQLAMNNVGTVAIAALPLKAVKALSTEDRVKYYESEVILSKIPQHTIGECIAQSFGHFFGKAKASRIKTADRLDPKGYVREAYQTPVDKALVEAHNRKERREKLLSQTPMSGDETVQAMSETRIKK